jgi:hypothetical protein
MKFEEMKVRQSGLSCCITAHSIPVLRSEDDSCRILLGIEALQLQGLDVTDMPMASSYTQTELVDLAGNAFAAGCYATAVMISMIVFSDLMPSSMAELASVQEEAREFTAAEQLEHDLGMS